ncbi:MAG: insulinase family protein [Saprospiraceae bacterium]|nr:insulinase family protein [Saprospiraceae bacterium]
MCIKCFLVVMLTFPSVLNYAQTMFKTTKKTSPDGKYTYEIVEGDPTKTRFYTLKNGLKVMLHQNTLEPKIMSFITTRAGGKNDPATNTGLAHYLEHMLFKGTENMGTVDFEKEKVFLDQIEMLYEKYNVSTDPAIRKKIYKEIDSVSTLASKLAVPNEYDKAMTSVGSSMTNAFTSKEITAYMENFPSTNLEKYLEIQKERFERPVFRLFHTELETVYEEKNMSLDRGNSKVFDGMFANLFQKHPYGTQTILGDVEHLKNPSLKAIRKFYDTYYVPNNMAVIMAGDLDPDATIKLVDKYFGNWIPKEIPAFKFEKEDPITEPRYVNVFSPDEESVAIGFRMPDQNHKDAVTADLLAAILYNGKSGLIDKNLVKKQKVLSAFGYTYLLTDYGMMYFGARPLKNQSLQEAEKLVLSQIEEIKKGNFDESLIKATVNNLKVGRVREQENAVNMAYTLNDLFGTGTSWETYLNNVEKTGSITKADVVAFANKWFGDNYVTIYKRTGPDTTLAKVVKPEITPLEIDRSKQSEFLKKLQEKPNKSLSPVFLDYEKDIKFGSIHKDVPVWSVPNNLNKLFSFYYVFDMGTFNMRKLPFAIEYVKFIGSKTKSNEQINKELYNLAVDFNIFTSNDQVYVSLSGLEENREKALMIIEDLMRNPKADADALKKFVESKIKERNDRTINRRDIFNNGLNSYADYGANNPFNDVISNTELRGLKAEELTEIIKSLFGYKHKVYYYGPKEVNPLVKELKASHPLAKNLKDYPAPKKYEESKANENTVFFVDYDMLQADIYFQRWDEKFNADKMPVITAFNEYYGGGMGSVVFQEIREAKALAYSTFGFYSTPAKAEDRHKSGFFVGTQSDKFSIAHDAMKDIIDNFRESETNWEVCKNSIKQNIESQRITKTNILFNYQSAQKRGMNKDSRMSVYNQIDKFTLEDIKVFHKTHLKDKKWNIRVMGSKDKIGMDNLAKYGKVVELTTKDIFGYEAEQTNIVP